MCPQFNLPLHIALCAPPNPSALDDRLEPHLGLLYIASTLEEVGYRVSYVDLQGIPEGQWNLPYADIYGITVYSVTLGPAAAIAERAKSINPDALVIAGGPHPTALPDWTLAHYLIYDAVVVGDGERVLRAYAHAATYGLVQDKRIILRDAVHDLNSLPFPARYLADYDTYTRQVMDHPALSVAGSRGCPYSCRFCFHPSHLMGGYRYRSVPSIVGELTHLIHIYGCRHFYFVDNIFSIPRGRMRELCHALAPLGIQFFYYDRCNPLVLEDYKLLHRAGARVCFLGVETAAPGLLRKMNKRHTPEDVEITVKRLQDAGIQARVALLFGFPGESEETVHKTMAFVERLHPDQVFVNFFVPFPGSMVWHNPNEFGVRNLDKDFRYYALQTKEGWAPATFETDTMSRREWERLAQEVVAWWQHLPVNPLGQPSWYKAFRQTGVTSHV